MEGNKFLSKNEGINSDNDEEEFIGKLISGDYCTSGTYETVYSEVWEMFYCMYTRRKNNRMTRKSFFGKIFGVSSFMSAYEKAKKESEDTRERVKYMIDYKNYSKNSIMYNILNNEKTIKTNMATRAEMDAINDENIYKEGLDFKRIPTATVDNLNMYFKTINACGETGFALSLDGVSERIGDPTLLRLLASQVICLGDQGSQEKVKGEFANFGKIETGLTSLEIKDDFAEIKKNHTVYSYLNYLYNKYVVPFTEDKNAKKDYEDIVNKIKNETLTNNEVTPGLEKVRDKILKKKFYEKLKTDDD